jgi:glycosyltransferase involved in cell wall biosynthesis
LFLGCSVTCSSGHRSFYFSPALLDSNAARADRQFASAVDAVFFRSAARWCHSKPQIPYFVYLDIVFHTFFENTFEQKDFIVGDLQRIYTAEAQFLENASAVFFESDWGLQKARVAYGLAGSHYQVAGRGGVLEPPGRDEWMGEQPYLLSIAMNFEQKGGDIVLRAFRQLKERHPKLRWHVVGGRPTGDWQSVDGLVYEGVLDPAKESDSVRFRRLLAQAFLWCIRRARTRPRWC